MALKVIPTILFLRVVIIVVVWTWLSFYIQIFIFIVIGIVLDVNRPYTTDSLIISPFLIHLFSNIIHFVSYLNIPT